jgi:mono/diheme cytochrome c family protein
VSCKCWLAVLISLAAFTQSKTQSILDGVFTAEQATRGQRLYAEACTSCHRDDLSGNEDGAPPLRGDAFLGRWRDRSLSEFFFVLTETMPQDAPGSLTPKQYADIISFILKNNGAPAGRMELPEDAESLGRIRFARTRGQR